MVLTEEAIVKLIDNKLKEQEAKFLIIIRDLQAVNTDLKKRIETLEKDVIMAFQELEDNKRDIHKIDQYQRRNNLEISGIPDSFEGEDLQNICTEIFNRICTPPGEAIDPDEAITHLDIEGCHRLKGTDKNNVPTTIIRFVNRRTCEDIMEHKTLIKNLNIDELGDAVKSIYVNENHCPYYRELAARCRRLRKHKMIDNTWSNNGIIKIKLCDGKFRIITHQADLDKLFPDYVYFN